MDQQYPVEEDGKCVGKVSVSQRGLYYSFQCRCRLNREGIHRLMVRCGQVQVNLGVLVPMDSGFGLNTQLPVKQIGDGPFAFRLIVPKEKRAGTFAPIRDDEPFVYITQLKKSFLMRRDGQLGIQIE